MSATTGSLFMTGWTGADPATALDPGARRYSFQRRILSEFFGKRFVLPALLDCIKGLEPLMHQIQGVVDQLSGLLGGHGESSSVELS